jgi:hypothetical protein
MYKWLWLLCAVQSNAMVQYLRTHMKAASISEIKNELKSIPPAQLTELCLRLARFKKENKELLTFLLFEANDMDGYIQAIKHEIDESFEEVNWKNVYFAKKTIRKILRTTNKFSKYTSSKHAEAELLIYFCKTLIGTGKSFKNSTALWNLYQSQVKKIKAVVYTLHEDLQFDFKADIEALEAVR